jgi:D-lactate dehydrogenase
MDEVIRALQASGLPFGAKAADPREIGAYPFHHDPKDTKVLWDVRKVSTAECVTHM